MKALLLWVIVIGLFSAGAIAFMTQMPGQAVLTSAGAASAEENEVESRLRTHVGVLSQDCGPRNNEYQTGIHGALGYMTRLLQRAGYEVRELSFDSRGRQAVNLEATLLGTRKKDEVIVLGANYDSDGHSPGAEDNASGCAALLEVARLLGETVSERTVRVVFFARSAGTFAGEEHSGSWTYAREARKRGDRIVAMLDFDCLGLYDDKPGSQSVPFPLGFVYPTTGNFVFFGGELGSRDLVRTAVNEMRRARFPAHGGAFPGIVPGMRSSDAAGFQAVGYPAIVVTDTGKRRFEKAGTVADTADRLAYPKLARATLGLWKVVLALNKTNGAL